MIKLDREGAPEGNGPAATAADPVVPALGRGDALVVVDVQCDFCPGGALAIIEGDRVVPVLNRWLAAASQGGALIATSRDEHPPDHLSFMEFGGPWPMHCVVGTLGAAHHPDLALPPEALEVRKGTDPKREQYSAFDGTGLAETLRAREIRRVWIGGLALDVCVRATALDARREGFEVQLIRAASRPVTAAGGEAALSEMAAAGVRLV